MSSNFGTRLFFCLCFVLVTESCRSQSLRFETAELIIETAEGKAIPISAEIARTREQLEYGLMYRESLASGNGMIFIFENTQLRSFWMKNTRIPLSIAFIAENGKILEIYDMEPFTLTPVRSTYPARFALEVPQAWFNRVGIRVGNRLLGADSLMRRK
ncbi:MAG: DUF192 domain-containing protein [Spirochaetaceae bacterium]|jgi:uncharacterized membrane protein (UPF0127 family)|nr:DUF192 domain-containing protein [Spirochaetaceae bacterium]